MCFVANLFFVLFVCFLAKFLVVVTHEDDRPRPPPLPIDWKGLSLLSWTNRVLHPCFVVGLFGGPWLSHSKRSAADQKLAGIARGPVREAPPVSSYLTAVKGTLPRSGVRLLCSADRPARLGTRSSWACLNTP